MGASLSTAQQAIVRSIIARAPMPGGTEHDAVEYCGGEDVLNDTDAADCEALPTHSVLLPSDALQTKLFGWPNEPLTPANSSTGKFGTEPFRQKHAGDFAVDFTLTTPSGASVSLSGLLEEKTVCLTFGMTTCPHYQTFAQSMEELAHKLGDRVHFVCVNSMQPHPKTDASFETGKRWKFPFSDITQPTNEELRQQDAAKVAAKLPSWIVVADAMRPELMNPVWSTYGPAPRSTFLIDKSGLIVSSAMWFSPTKTEAAIERLLRAKGVVAVA